MREHSVSLSIIGLLQIIKLPWILKVFWSPAIDRYCHTVSDYKRTIIGTEIVYALLILVTSLFDYTILPTSFHILIALILLALVASATQDIATDALAIRTSMPKQRGLLNSMHCPLCRLYRNVCNPKCHCLGVFPLHSSNEQNCKTTMNEAIFKKYNVPVPRYTSYPTANEFEVFDEDRYLKAVEASNNAAANNTSFYIHVPFCRHLCHYCGCNSVAMAKPARVKEYFETLHKEIDLLLPHLRSDRKISQIHYGGGSPSSIPLPYIRALNEHLLGAFDTIDKPEIAIECHPGYLESTDWQYLLDSGFNRFSLGIQDFNTSVLHTVNRRPSILPVAKIMDILRNGGAKINFDFIYGLPGQTVKEFVSTIEAAIELHPDRLVTFSYAHLPSLFKRQMILEKAGLPPQNEKLMMFEEASRLLQSAGYCPIGMDHFVLPYDDLNVALQHHTLHRNFQGYCPRRITAQVYAFGVSGISQLDKAYSQNTKDISAYISQVNAGHLPIAKGYALASWQRITREIIESIMCNTAVNWQDMAERLHCNVDDIKQAIHYDEAQLKELQADGIITFDAQSVQLTTEGKPFVRNVAAAFDTMMRNNHKLFSKPV